MSSSDPPEHDLDALVTRLRTRVEERRRSGAYPPGLEHELSEHFRRVTSQRPKEETADFSADLERLGAAMAFSPGRIPQASNLPGGAALHRLVSRMVHRQTQGVIEQMTGFASVVRTLFERMATLVEGLDGHVHVDVLGQLDAIVDRLASYERASGDAAPEVLELRRRVEELEAAEAARRFRPWYSNDRFEEEFRGTREGLLERYRDLAQLFEGSEGPVVDVGCGRGEFLELLGDLGLQPSGVELDPDLVDAAVGDGFDVVHADGVAWLATQVDRSLGGVAMIQVVEHLTAQQVVDVVAILADKMRPGGRVVIETVNPQSLYVYARSFYLDPTHVRPVHPAWLTFLFREAGFAEVYIDWRSPPPADEVLDETEGSSANVRRLNQLLFAPQDFALIANR